MEDLLAELTIDILSRLPVNTIIHCKLVCRNWRNLVSDSFFVNLHLSKSHPTGLVIHRYKDYKDPGILEWVEIEDKVDHHGLHHDPFMTLDLNLAPILRNSDIDQMVSVNGLIFLWRHSPGLTFDDTYICNPVTREIMILPRQLKYKEGFFTVVYGFGVNSLTGEYHVVRIFQGVIPVNAYKSSRVSVLLEAEVYTLGTGQWRSLGRVPYMLHVSHGAFLNDHCHWLVSMKEDAPERICTFDLNTETFQLFPSPPSEGIVENCIQRLAVLKGCLCKSDAEDFKFTIWVMKEYGIKKSWHKDVVITEVISKWPGWPYFDYIYPIEGLKDGTILLVSETGGSLFAFYPRNSTIEKIETFERLDGGLAYRPSFLKLQNFESERVHMF